MSAMRRLTASLTRSPAGVHHVEQRTIANAAHRLRAGSIEQPKHLVDAEHLREAPPDPRALDERAWIRLRRALAHEKPCEPPHRRQVPRGRARAEPAPPEGDHEHGDERPSSPLGAVTPLSSACRAQLREIARVRVDRSRRQRALDPQAIEVGIDPSVEVHRGPAYGFSAPHQSSELGSFSIEPEPGVVIG